MTVLLTGATGSIGHELVERLAGTRRLRLLARRGRFDSARERLGSVLGPRGRIALDAGSIEVFEGDLADPELGLSPACLLRLGAGVSVVLHVAARTDFLGESVEDYRSVNIDGARRLFDVAAAAGCPFLHVSTAYVAGARTGVVREDELDAGQAHHNGYERSKFEAEQVLLDRARRTGTPLAIFRPGIVLPESPRSDVPDGPGPLAYLRLLANLEGRRARRERVIRYRGDPRSALHLVPLSAVADVLVQAVRRTWHGVSTYHVTPALALRLGRVSQVMNECLTGLRTSVEPDVDPAGFDRYEALLERTFSSYRDYLYLDHRFDRVALDSDFETDCELDEAWLRRVFDEHLRVWRAERVAQVAAGQAVRRVRTYFSRFLPAFPGRRLVPGIESLSVDFTVTVPGAGSHRLQIERGILVGVEPTAARSDEIDYETDAASLLEAVSGRARPSQLFFQRRVRIRGDLHRALRTATALEDFFRLHPFEATWLPESAA